MILFFVLGDDVLKYHTMLMSMIYYHGLPHKGVSDSNRVSHRLWR